MLYNGNIIKLIIASIAISYKCDISTYSNIILKLLINDFLGGLYIAFIGLLLKLFKIFDL
jgi:hypothetical protein